MRERPNWTTYYLNIAHTVAQRGDCTRRQVGAVVVRRDKSISSTGYNGVGPGMRGCLAGACPRSLSHVDPGSSYDTGPGACIATHAEANALAFAREDTTGHDIYVTCPPCDGCLKTMRAHRIRNCYWPTGTTTVTEERT